MKGGHILTEELIFSEMRNRSIPNHDSEKLLFLGKNAWEGPRDLCSQGGQT